jgi:hypothetical protein
MPADQMNADASVERLAVQKRAPQAPVFCNGVFDSTPASLSVVLNKIIDRVFRKALTPSSRAEVCPGRVLSELLFIVPVERLAVQQQARRRVGPAILHRCPCGGIVCCNGMFDSPAHCEQSDGMVAVILRISSTPTIARFVLSPCPYGPLFSTFARMSTYSGGARPTPASTAEVISDHHGWSA